MLKRFICALLVIAAGLGIWYVANTTEDPDYTADRESMTQTGSEEAGASSEVATEAEEDNSLTLWYTDEALTDYLSSVALSYEQDTGIKVNIVRKDGVQFLETINAVSIADAKDREEAMPDLYITSHDDLQRAYLSGLAAIITDPDGRYYADIGFLCRHIAPDFVTRTEDGAWMLRRAPLPEDAVVLFGEKILLDLEKADFCLRADPYWLEEGIFSLLERFSPVLEADGRRYERTGETALCPEDIWDAVSPEGRAMWQKDGDWWLEDGQGLVWRYAPADGCEE